MKTIRKPAFVTQRRGKQSYIATALLAAVAKETPWIAIIGAGLAGAANMFLNRNKAGK